MPDDRKRVTTEEAMDHLLGGTGFRWNMTFREMWLRVAAQQYLRDHPDADVSLVLEDAEGLRERDLQCDQDHEVRGGDGTGVAAVIAGGVGIFMVLVWLLARWVF